MGGHLGLLNLGGREATMQPIRSETAQEERWEHFPHQADIGVRGIGSTKETAFEQAGLALTAVITEPKSVTRCKPCQSLVKRLTMSCCWLIG